MTYYYYLITFLISVVYAEYNEKTTITFAGNKIYGGTDAKEGFAPHQVSLRRAKNTTRHFCGGSFVSECHVVTAAHCAPACRNGTCKVAYGSTALSQQTLADVESITPHEDYFLDHNDRGIVTIQNDIAIIKLLSDNYPKFNEITNKIELNRKSVPLLTNLLTTGWGLTNRGETQVPEHLQVTRVRASICPPDQRDWYNFICTNALMTGVCPGDSGGPLLYRGKLAGITSFGNGCGSTISENGFTEVKSYADWIDEKIEEMPC